MGYYSQVAFAIPVEDVPGLWKVAEESKEGENLLTLATTTKTLFTKWTHNSKGNWITENVGFAIFLFDWTKWYNGYPSIDAIERYVKSLSHYKFVRVGEETGDVETDEDGEVDYDDFGPVTSIEVCGNPCTLDSIRKEE
jgi:hypothetical protein